MPCDSVTYAELDAGKFSGPILLAALDRLGLHPVHDRAKHYSFDGGEFDSATGKFTFRVSAYGGKTAEQKGAEVRQAYSAEIVRTQAKRFGWTLKETGKNQFQIAKR